MNCKHLSLALLIVSFLGCGPDSNDHSPEESSETEYRLTEVEANEILQDHLNRYKNMPIDELELQFGGGYAVLEAEGGKESKYNYRINTTVYWENEENSTIRVDASFSETESGDLKTYTTIAQDSVVIYR